MNHHLRCSSSSKTQAPRILMYSHDSFGLGHLRRSLTIAQEVSGCMERANIIVVTGSACATQFPIPPNVDVVKLPCVTKNSLGAYVSRTLPIPIEGLLHIRRRILLEILRSFQPEMVIVDHKPIGLEGELTQFLEEAKSMGVYLMLGLRDIMDSPEAVEREWGHPEVRRALAFHYDRILVYGDKKVFDPGKEYQVLKRFEHRLDFTGYVIRPLSRTTSSAKPAAVPMVLVTTGGGEDGDSLVDTYLDAMSSDPKPQWHTKLVLGPLCHASRAREIRLRVRRQGLDIDVHTFYADIPRLLAESSAVVSMAGYNTVAEILRAGTPAVLCPRSRPRQEQLIRARRLADLGLATCLPAPDGGVMREAVEDALEKGRTVGSALSLQGSAYVADTVARLLVKPKMQINQAVEA